MRTVNSSKHVDIFTAVYLYVVHYAAKVKQLEFVKMICLKRTDVAHVVERKNLYEDVQVLFCDQKVLEEFLLHIKFANEPAFDTGRVCHNLFSGFWEKAYLMDLTGYTDCICKCRDGITSYVKEDSFTWLYGYWLPISSNSFRNLSQHSHGLHCWYSCTSYGINICWKSVLTWGFSC